jgi:phosphomannomutase / phosphoglucomutase
MKVPSEVFREYDVRGLVGEQLTPELARLLGKAVGTVVRRAGKSRVVVGRDHRASGPELAQGLMDGLTSTGCNAIAIGVCPTPVGYWAIEHLKADGGGVQITGSHNPPEYNGFKMTLLGRALHGEEIQGLKKLIEKDDFETGAGSVSEERVLDAYIAELAKTLRPAERRLKIVVDAGNGTGGMTGVPLYQKLGYEVIPLFCEPDSRFPHHHPDPTVEKNLADLRREVTARGADLGIAFDGDADRIGVIDEKGGILWGDRLLILLARSVLRDVPGGTIIGEVKCSKTLYDDVAKHGGKPLMWKAGHSLIKSKMKETNAPLAGEMSGHVFFKHRYYGFDDAEAFLAGARLRVIRDAVEGEIQKARRELE